MLINEQHPSRPTRRQLLKQVASGAALACIGSRAALAQKPSAAPSTREAVLDRLKGPMASITIPYAKDYSIDHGSLRGWVDFMCQERVPVLFLTFGDSELGFLSEAEIEAVIRTVARQANGRSLVVGGTGSWWTGRMIDFINRLADSGVDAMSIHFPHNVRNENEIYTAFEQIDQATQLPLLAYDTGYSVDLMVRLARLPGVVGDKCHQELYRYHDYIRATRNEKFAVLGAGQMRHFLFGYLIGSPAYLCPLAPFAPQISLAFYEALKKNDLDAAREVMFKYEDPLMDVSIPLDYPHSYKSLLYLTGHYKTNLIRPPKISHGPEELAKLRAYLETSGLMKEKK